MTLGALLAQAAAHPGGFLEQAHRLEMVQRLLAGVLIASEAERLAPGLARRLLDDLGGATAGTWAVWLGLLARGPVASELRAVRAGVLDPAPGARPLDLLLRPQESALRHAGRAPRGLDDTLQPAWRAVHALVEPLDALPVRGVGDALTIGPWATAPFVRRPASDEPLWICDRASLGRRGVGRWLTWTERAVHAEADPRGPVRASLQARAATDWLQAGRGEGPGAAPPPGLRRVAVAADVVGHALRLAQTWRGSRRAVIVRPPDRRTSVADQARRLVSDKPLSLPEVVARVVERRAASTLVEVVVVLCPGPGEAAAMLAVCDAFEPAIRVIAAVTPATWRAWPPAARDRFNPIVPRDPLPDAVQGFLADGVGLVDAWRLGAVSVFGLQAPGVAERWLDVLWGRQPLLASKLGLTWLTGGAMALAPDGQVRLGHPGWWALAQGLAGRPAEGPADAPFRAGRLLRGALWRR